jgi:uncharacterized DUF497 family protein
MEFEWNPGKARANLKKHRVAFLTAIEVFSDVLSSTVLDPDSSEDEPRYLIFGQTSADKHLVVCFTERDNRVRLISARHMTPLERKAYEH